MKLARGKFLGAVLVALLGLGAVWIAGSKLRGFEESGRVSKSPAKSKSIAWDARNSSGNEIVITGTVTGDGRPLRHALVALEPFGKAEADSQGRYVIRSGSRPATCVFSTLTATGSGFGQMVVKDRPIRREAHLVWNVNLKKRPTTIVFPAAPKGSASTCVHPAELKPPAPEWPVIDSGSLAFPEQSWFVDSSRGYGLAYNCDDRQEVQEIHCSVQVPTTADSGRTWSPTSEAIRISYRRMGRYDFFNAGLRFADTNNGWIFGRKLLSTHDGGKTWAEEALPASVIALTFAGDAVWAVAGACEDRQCPPSVYISPVGGGDWRPLKSQPTGSLQDAQLFGLGPNLLFATTTIGTDAGQEGRLNLTRDGGASWYESTMPCYVYGVKGTLAVLSADRIWLACGDQPSTSDQPTRIYQSSNQGRNWRLVAQTPWHAPTPRKVIGNIPQDGFLGDLVATANGRLFMSRGKFGTVARSTDGGTNWTSQLEDDGGGGYGVQFIDNLHGWARTTGALYRTSDGGEHWRRVAYRPGYASYPEPAQLPSNSRTQPSS
ncbi:MAG: hypothetical protein ACR2FO_04915 [Actinomycetota bacterium]